MSSCSSPWRRYRCTCCRRCLGPSIGDCSRRDAGLSSKRTSVGCGRPALGPIGVRFRHRSRRGRRSHEDKRIPIALQSPLPVAEVFMGAKHPDPGIERKIVKAACPHDCPDTCGMHISVENGVAVKVEGAKDMPFTQGTLCTKVARYLDRTYSKDRVLHPMKRVGAKGEGRFERISWDEALDTIAAKFKQIAAVEPQSILPCSYAGTMGLVQYASMDRRFFHKLGASLLDRTLCSSAGEVGMDPERFDEAKLILIWGSNPIVSNLHLWSRVQEAKRRGAKVIAIDPYRSLTAAKCDRHLAPLPGTDAALALGMMHVIIGEGLNDDDYVRRHTLGFAQLRERVQDYPPEKAAAICGLARDEIVALAREYALSLIHI